MEEATLIGQPELWIPPQSPADQEEAKKRFLGSLDIDSVDVEGEEVAF